MIIICILTHITCKQINHYYNKRRGVSIFHEILGFDLEKKRNKDFGDKHCQQISIKIPFQVLMRSKMFN